MTHFVSALNASQLTSLSLAGNRTLSDEFTSNLLSRLESSTLESLDLSMSGITALSSPAIIVSITSRYELVRLQLCLKDHLLLRTSLPRPHPIFSELSNSTAIVSVVRPFATLNVPIGFPTSISLDWRCSQTLFQETRRGHRFIR